MHRRSIVCLSAILVLLCAGIASAEEVADVTAEVDTGITAWMLTSTALVLLMVPGLALFYGGLVRTKNVLGTMMHSFVAIAIIGVSWAVVGFALAFGESRGGIIGFEGGLLFLHSIDGTTGRWGDGVPDLLFSMFQGKFAIITPALIAGAFAERVKFRGYCLFILLWSLLIYCPLCHWIWGGGFLSGKAIDFAGGTVIHISAGVAGLVAAFYLGRRRGYPQTAMHPNNLTMTLLGAGLLWVGWFGFNAGSSVNSGLITAQALTVTQVAAASGALMWMLIESLHLKKATSLGFVSGILAGLVAITPAAGDVPVYGAMILGVLGTSFAYTAILIKGKLGYDDTLDVFGIHGIAGIVGAIGLTFVLRNMPGGHIFSSAWMTQLWYQVEGVGISIVYSGIVTLILLVLVDKTLGLKLSDREQRAGMDHELHGEHGYGLLNLN